MSNLSWLRDSGPAAPVPAAIPWCVLVVDDDPDVHTATQLCLRHFRFEGRPVELLSAHSAVEGRSILEQRSDVAMILLDVVMETDRAGLDLARQIRDELHDHTVRIVLRTGEPGQAPALEVTERYEIDDYRNKTELTFERMTVLTQTALRTHRLLKELEERQQTLLQYNTELEHFTRVASHDMKTPLRSIVSFAQLVEQRCAERLEPRERELLRFVVQGGNELYALIENLLEYSTVGRAPAPLGTIDLDSVLHKVCADLQGVIATRGAQVACSELPEVHGNAATLEQLFRNLLENAIKFQPGPAPTVRISAVRSGSNWEIRMQDRGVGIEAEYLDRIFQPFQKLHPSDAFPGTGIGLALCRKVAHLHHGDIRAESMPGEGTTIVVQLPVARTTRT